MHSERSRVQKLRLYFDQLAAGVSSKPLAAVNRAVYVGDGTPLLRGAGVAVALCANCAWQGSPAIEVTSGPSGARLLRWELSSGQPALLEGAGVESQLAIEETLDLAVDARYLMRCDRVNFPSGGVALTHTHQGPGIRCLQSGRIRVMTQGRDFWVEAGGAWFETGTDPVYAQTWPDSPSHFIRVMILPVALRGKSSIQYVRPEDRLRPKDQTYQIFADEPIDL